MQELARRYMTLKQGDIRQNILNEPENPIKIGMWPCIGNSPSSQVAMGLMSVLALWLETWQNVTVYRVFARFDLEQPEANDRTQFTVDDWMFDGLDDNVGLWGKLNRTEADGYVLSLELESDLDGTDDEINLNYTADTLRGLFQQFPAIANDVVKSLGLKPTTATAGFGDCQLSTQALIEVLEALFAFELTLLCWLADEDPQITPSHAHLVSTGVRHNESATAWIVAKMTERAMLAGFEPIHEHLLEADNIDEQLDQPHATLILSRLMFQEGHATSAIDAVNQALENLQQSTGISARQGALIVSLRVTLAGFYLQMERFKDAVDTLQEAIIRDLTRMEVITSGANALYALYAQTLLAIHNRQGRVGEYVLIPAELQREFDTALLWEACYAYQQADEIEARGQADAEKRTGYLASQVLLFIRMNVADKNLWQAFESLALVDVDGEMTRHVVDEFFALEDVEPAINILENVIKKHPERYGHYLALANAYILDAESLQAVDRALEILDDVRNHTEDTTLIAEVDRLTLIAEDPEFEAFIGEVTDKIGAGTALSDSEVEYLEESVARAPLYSELYVLLAQAYLIWDDAATAIEVLLDAQTHTPEDPDVIEWLAKTLWKQEQEAVALQYLQKGLAAKQNANHVPLLALAGQYAFELGEDDTARQLLARAEAVAPQHPALTRARRRISELSR